ncbi:MAG: N-6 DNA methylase [Actinomycetota bacterium]
MTAAGGNSNGPARGGDLWRISRDRSGKPTKGGKPLSDRRGEVLFIDARKLGTMTSRTQKELTNDDITRIADTYHAWRGQEGEYEDASGLCKAAALEEIRRHGHVLTPGRYVGGADGEDDAEPFEEKMDRLVRQLREQQAGAAKLHTTIARNLAELGWPRGAYPPDTTAVVTTNSKESPHGA